MAALGAHLTRSRRRRGTRALGPSARRRSRPASGSAASSPTTRSGRRGGSTQRAEQARRGGAAPHLRARADGRARRGGREARHVERPGRLGEGRARPASSARPAAGPAGRPRSARRRTGWSSRSIASRCSTSSSPRSTSTSSPARSPSSWSRTLGRVGRLGEGVLVGSVSMGLGLELDVVVLCGLAEGSFPATVRDDSLLPDREREAAGGELALRRHQIDRQHRELLATPGRRRAPGAQVPRGDLRRSSERVPSRWVLDVASELAGERMWREHLFARRCAVGRPRRLVRRRAAQPRRSRPPRRSTGSGPCSRRVPVGASSPASPPAIDAAMATGVAVVDRRGARALHPVRRQPRRAGRSPRRSTRAARPPASSAGRSAPSPTRCRTSCASNRSRTPRSSSRSRRSTGGAWSTRSSSSS